MKSRVLGLLFLSYCLAITWGSAQLSAPAAPSLSVPRLAIVPEAGDARAAQFGDLITAAFSQAGASGATNPSEFDLVERADLSRLADEAEIRGLGAGERTLGLARLAKADGLIHIVMSRTETGGPACSFRMVDCGTGLVLSSLRLPCDNAGGDKSTADQVAAILRYSASRVGKAVGGEKPMIVSLLGFRSERDPGDSTATELNFTLAQCLSNQPGIRVSERWKLDDTVFERSLSTEDTGSLVAGSILLDGSFVPAKSGPGAIVRLRMRGEALKTPRTEELTCPAFTPSAMADSITSAVSTVLKHRSPVTADRSGEAAEFTRLAYWLLTRGQFVEAAQAAESAVALGDQTPDARWARINAYSRIVWPETSRIETSPIGCWRDIRYLRKLPQARFEAGLAAMRRATDHMADLSATEWADFRGIQGFTNDKARGLECALVSLGEDVLRSAHERKEWRDRASQTSGLRASLRRLSMPRGKLGTARQDLWYGGFWYMFDRPQDALEVWRARLAAEANPTPDSPGVRFRKSMFMTRADWNDTSERRCLIGWSDPDDAASIRMWNGFLAEKAASSILADQVDSIAFGALTECDPARQMAIYYRYIALLERRGAELATEAGQMAFTAVNVPWHPYYQKEVGLELYPRFLKAVAGIAERADWMSEPFLSLVGSAISSIPKDEERKAIQRQLKDDAVRIVVAFERFIEKAPRDKRWGGATRDAGNLLAGSLRKDMAKCFSGLPPEPPAVAAGAAVPILSWTAGNEEASKDSMDDYIDGNHIVWNGRRLIFPLNRMQLVVLDPENLRHEIHPMPPQNDTTDPFCLCQHKDGVLLHIGTGAGSTWTGRMDNGSLSWDKWPESPPLDHNLFWHVTADRDREYFMSFKYQNNVKAHMVVCHERNAFQVLVSSNVVPPRNPMDGLAPHSIEGMVPWPKGRQSVILRHTLKNEESLFGLETGRPVCSLGCLGRTQTTGDIPLRWARYGGNLSFVIAFDPEKDKPSLILRNANPKAGWSPGDGWKDERPLVDATPDLASGIVAPVIRDGKLWILKWRGESSGKTSRRAEDLQLACVDIASGKKIFVPLGYGAPRLRGGGSRIGSGPFFTDLTQPLFLPESLTCTPQGLFFTILCWIDAYGADVRSFGPALSPALHHIRWADVDAWIGKAHPGFGKPSAGRKSAVSP